MTSRRSGAALCLGLLIAAYSSPSAALKAKPIAVSDLEARGGVTADQAALLSDVLRYELYNTGRFSVMNREDMKAIFQEIKFQQSGACDTTTCIVEVGQALGVDQMIVGTVGKLSGTYVLTAKLVDIRKMSNEIMVNEWFDEKTGEIQLLMARVAEKLAGMTPSKRASSLSALPPPPEPPKPDELIIQLTPHPMFWNGKSVMGRWKDKLYLGGAKANNLGFRDLVLVREGRDVLRLSNSFFYTIKTHPGEVAKATVFMESRWLDYLKEVKEVLGTRVWKDRLSHANAYPTQLVIGKQALALRPSTTQEEVESFMAGDDQWKLFRKSPRKMIYELHSGRSPSIIYRWVEGRLSQIDFEDWLYDARDVTQEQSRRGPYQPWDPKSGWVAGYRFSWDGAWPKGLNSGALVEYRPTFRVGVALEFLVGFRGNAEIKESSGTIRWRTNEKRRSIFLMGGYVDRWTKYSYKLVGGTGPSYTLWDTVPQRGWLMGLGWNPALSQNVELSLDGQFRAWSKRGESIISKDASDPSSVQIRHPKNKSLRAALGINYRF